MMQHIRKLFDKMPRPNTVADSETPAASFDSSGHHRSEWANALLPVCFGAAMAIAMMSVQARSEVPTFVHFVSLGVMFAIASFFVSKFMVIKFPIIARVLEGVGVFVMVTAFFVAMSVPLPRFLKLTNCLVYVVSFLAILVCCCL